MRSYPRHFALTGGYAPGTRVPRALAAGERLTVRCSPAEVVEDASRPHLVALKPVALYLADAPVAASSWRIHDVRVDGRSQLDGDEVDGDLLSPRHAGVGRVISAGLDTIRPGGSLELDVSLREISGVGRATFYGAVALVDVDPRRGTSEYSGPVRLRGWDGELVAATCDGPSRVPPGHDAWFVARPREQSIRPTRLAIERDWGDWLVEDVHVGGRTQFLHSGPVPGDCLHPEAVDVFAKLDVAHPGDPLAIRARYVGPNPRGGRLGVVAYGELE